MSDRKDNRIDMAVERTIVRTRLTGPEFRVLTLVAVMERSPQVSGVVIQSVRPRSLWRPGVRADLLVAVTS
jgi:hypothetical protein